MPTPGPGLSEVSDAVESTIRAHVPLSPDATVSVWCADVTGRPHVTRRADAAHYAASTMKLPLVVAAYRLHARGALDLDLPVRVHNSFQSALDGRNFSVAHADDQDDETWSRLGEEVPARTLARHAIVRSGNLATNLVLEMVGFDEVRAVLADAGCGPETVVARGIEDRAAREARLDNRVTAADLGRVMCAVATGTLAPPDTCREIEAVLAAQEHREMIPAGLPGDVRVANKTGWVDGVAHDVALVRPRDAPSYVLSVCTTTSLPEHEAFRLVAGISRSVWEELVG